MVEKEYIAAGEELGTPTPSPGTSCRGDKMQPQPPVRPDPPKRRRDVERPLADDEIVVETYVMKKDVRGTSKDPRAYPGREQWRMTVELVAERGRFVVQGRAGAV